MQKVILHDGIQREEALSKITNLFPNVDANSFYAYLTFRKASGHFDNCLEAYFSTYGMSAGRFSLLLALSARPAGMMPSELAQECGVTQATISGLLNGLEKAQMIVRSTHNLDGRSSVIRLSESGQRLMDQIKPEFMGCIDRMMASFSGEEKEGLISFLTRFCENFRYLTQLTLDRRTAYSS